MVLNRHRDGAVQLLWLGFIALTAMASCPAFAGDEANLVHNGDAEQVDEQGNLVAWSARARSGSMTLAADEQDKSQGKRSARVEGHGPEGVNFAVQTGNLATQRNPHDTTYLFTADVKAEVTQGAKFAAYFRIGSSDDLQIVKAEPNVGWQTLRHRFVVKANQTFDRLDLSGAASSEIVIHIDNVSLLQVSAEGDGAQGDATPQMLAEQRDSDGDGINEIIVENRFYRMVVAPAAGGAIVQFGVKPAQEPMLILDDKQRGGLLGDVVEGDAYGGYWQGPWDAEVQSDAPGSVRIDLTKRGREDSPLHEIMLRKTLTATMDSPVVRVAVLATTLDGKSTPDLLRYAVHNRVAHPERPTRYYMPNWSAVEAGEFLFAKTMASQTQAVRNPPQGWLAVLPQDAAGFAFRMTRGDPATLYSWRKNRMATLEWTYGAGALGDADVPLEYELFAIAHLPRVDGLLQSVAGAIVIDDESKMSEAIKGSLLLSGEPGLYTIALDWRRLPDAGWHSLTKQTTRIDRDALQSTAMPFVVPVDGPGSYVIRARSLAGDHQLGLIERCIVVETASGTYHATSTLTEVDQLGRTHHEGAIPLSAGHETVIRKLLPMDSRLVRGFASAPLDGRTDTRHAGGGIAEWRGESGLPAVNYSEFNGNNGLHIALPPEGFNAVQIHGGWTGRLFADHDSLSAPPPEAPAMVRVDPRFGVARLLLPEVATPARVSFFYDGGSQQPLADVSFLRVTHGSEFRGSLEPITLSGGTWTESSGTLQDVMLRRFKLAKGAMQLGAGSDVIAPLARGEYLHLLTPPLDPATGIAAITFDLDIEGIAADTLLTLRVQDPLDPMRECMGVDLLVPGPGRYRVTLDMPDVVLLAAQAPAGREPRMAGELATSSLWVSLAADSAMALRDVQMTLHRTPRDEAIVEAGAWRKFLLRGLFSTMSEPRPWMHLQPGTPIREQIATNTIIRPYRESLLELLTCAEVTRLLLPEDDVVRQYHDWLYQNIDRRLAPPPPTLPADDGSPRWAMLLRENWRLLQAIPQWWVDHRMTPDGQFGGGINDDTDLFQTWQCFPMIESAPLGEALRDASQKLTDLAMRVTLEEGINRRSMDALHAYEEGVNQLALNAWWFYGDPEHFERVMDSARSSIKLLVELPDGRVHFGGPEMGIEQARHGFADPGRTVAFARLFLHPMYEVALYNRNPMVIERMETWGRTWAGYQKPGAFVEQVEITTGTPSRTFPHARGPVDEWIAVHQVTGDDAWLDLITMGMKPGEYWGFNATYGDMPQASVRWPSPYQQMMRDSFPSAGYSGLLLSGDRDSLEKWLEKSISWFGRFPWMHTEAEQKTDRVLNYQATAAIASYLGGAPNRNRWVRTNAVSYEGLRGEDFAALVWESGHDRLRVAIYNFRDQPITGRLRLWALEHGRYRLQQGIDADDDGHIDVRGDGAELVLQPFDTLDLHLAPRQVTVLQIEQAERLDDVRTRADLAVSPRLIEVDGRTVRGTVHNIGSATARDIVVAIVDQAGRVQAQQSLGDLDAPLDLVPRRVPFTLTLPNVPAEGWQLVVDPDQQVPEILEKNNRIALTATGPLP